MASKMSSICWYMVTRWVFVAVAIMLCFVLGSPARLGGACWLVVNHFVEEDGGESL